MPKHSENINVNLPNIPILYTDMILMNVNEDGVIIDVCQKGAKHNEYTIISRIGMSREHAKKFVKKFSEIIALTSAKSDSTKEN